MVRRVAERSPGPGRRAAPAIVALLCAGCAPVAASPARADESGSIDSVDAELTALSGDVTATQRATFRAVLEDTIGKDSYACQPSPRAVFFGPAPEGERLIVGEMPHYGFFFGPMRYRVRRSSQGAGARWAVKVTLAIDPPAFHGDLELPDCGLVREIGGDEGRCSGTPYSASPKTEACPGSGSFAITATPGHVRALLARWSREAERYYTRDARAFGLPIDYDFELVLADEAPELSADLRVPLSPTCGRTPYFTAFRSGWSLPIVAHEVGHVLGLLDEYEAFSGLSPLYPKTPFPGAEVSRMGLSMREGTRVLPLHHYLILRRYFCAEPKGGGFWGAPPL